MLTKRSKSVFRVLYAFGTETSSRRNWKLGSKKMEWSTFIIAKFLKNSSKKCWQNGPKVCFECFMPSAQKPLLAEIGSSEAWKWTGQHLFLPKFWRMKWRNADTTVRKCLSSALCVRHRNLFSPKFEARKHENGMVNIYSCQNFEEWFEEMLTKRFQSVLRVLCSFGTETTFRRNFIMLIRQSISVNGCFICDFVSVWVSQ